jgi:hypothetical protein
MLLLNYKNVRKSKKEDHCCVRSSSCIGTAEIGILTKQETKVVDQHKLDQ